VDLVVALQLWTLLVIPLGVLVASEAARARRSGWLGLLVALLVLAPVAFWFGPLVADVQNLPAVLHPSGQVIGYSSSPTITDVGQAIGLLSLPVAALIASFMPFMSSASGSSPSVATSQHATAAPTSAEAGRGELRTLIGGALVSLVVMSVLGYLGNTDSLAQYAMSHPAPGQGPFGDPSGAFFAQGLANTLWTPLVALPVAVVSLALAHAAQTGRHGWLAVWIGLLVVVVLATATGAFRYTGLIYLVAASFDLHVPTLQQIELVSLGAPALIMLVALVYALTAQRPQQRAAVPAMA
jgi:hypothetical protein